MKTMLLHVDNDVDNISAYTQAVDNLKHGQVVAFPTETVYGLGAIATNEEAVKKIFAAKGRPADNPLIVHIGDMNELPKYVEHVSENVRACIQAFWPGPLTIVLKAKPNIFAPSVTAGLQTVGIRMPDHPVALKLLQMLGQPLAAPSANKSGKPSPTEASHVMNDLYGMIPIVLDGGATGLGLESTVLDMTVTPPVILRPGGVTKEMLEAVIGPVIQPTTEHHHVASTPKSPGMKYAHYAPEAPVYLIDCDEERVQEAILNIHATQRKVALLAPKNFEHLGADWFFAMGDNNQQQMAAILYKALRACDDTSADIILATTTSSEGVGAAIMNRLEKAANGNYFRGDERQEQCETRG